MSKQQLWFEKIGFTHNPFTIKPGFFDDEVVGYDDEVDTLISKIENDEMIYLEGSYGQGKTTILTYIINEFKGRNRIIKIQRSRNDKPFNYDKLLVGASGVIKRSFNMRSKDVILIVDEANSLNDKDCHQIEDLYNDGHFKAVLFVDNSYKKAPFTQSIKDTIGKNVVSLQPISAESAVELIHSRLGEDSELISDKYISDLFAASKGSMRLFLNKVEDACRHAIEHDRDSVGEKDVKAVA